MITPIVAYQSATRPALLDALGAPPPSATASRVRAQRWPQALLIQRLSTFDGHLSTAVCVYDHAHQERHHRHRFGPVRCRHLHRQGRHHDHRARADASGRYGRRRLGQARDARRHRRPHAPRHAVRRHDVGRRLRDRHDRGGAWRHDDAHRLRDSGLRRRALSGVRRLDEARRGEGGHRLRVPHDRARAERSGVGRHGSHGAARRRHVVQAVHGLPGRLHGRRRDDLQGPAADARERRPDLHARRERRRHRHAGEGGAAQGRDARRSITR